MFDIHFDDAEAAELFLDQLRERGFNAEFIVDAFAGEDDLEDTARIIQVEIINDDVQALIDQFEAWVTESGESGTSAVAQPLELPSGPKLIKNPPKTNS